MHEWTILISDGLDESGQALLRAAAQVDDRAGITPAELLQAAPDCDALIVRSRTRVTAEVLASSPRLKVVGRAGTGLDNVDILAASKRGIVVMNTPGGNTISTAEHAISLMLAMARNVPQASQSMREGKWEKKKFQGTDIFNKTLGVIGLGRIGRPCG